MFIYNVKLNSKTLAKMLLITFGIIIMFFLLFSVYKAVAKSFKVKDELPNLDVNIIEAEEYSNILKSVTEDIDSYIGEKISFSGYVFRLSDFQNNQFVLARDMIVENTNNKTLIVGFLCEYDDASSFADNSWVEITGTIKKGYYHQEIPILEINSIQQIEVPSQDLTVPPPDSTYIPTSSIF